MMTAARLRLLAELLDEFAADTDARLTFGVSRHANAARTVATRARHIAVARAAEEADPDSFEGVTA